MTLIVEIAFAVFDDKDGKANLFKYECELDVLIPRGSSKKNVNKLVEISCCHIM